MREQFENLPRVKPILRLVKYSESSDGYDPLDQKSIYEKYADWLNGAWYAFQEQQKSHQQETERLKTQLLAAEAEIARLQSALDELKTTCERHNDPMWRGFANDYDKGFSDCAASLLDGINRITGTDK